MSEKSSTFAPHFVLMRTPYVRVMRNRIGDRETMKYSRSSLNRVGAYLYAPGVDAFKRSKAMRIVSDWRMTQLPVLREFVEGLTAYLAERGVASAMFTQTEQSLSGDEAVILVSIEKMQELREAYPSYFLDTKEFLMALEKFNASCAIYRK